MMEEITTSELKNPNLVENDVDYDTLLSYAGKIGWYQALLVFSTLPFYFFGSCIYFSQMFMTEVPPQHWCWIPELENLTETDRRSVAIPRDNTTRFGYSHCEAYDANWTDVLVTGHIPDNTTTIPCRNGWEFDRTDIPYPTISSDLEWVCDKKSYQATAQTLFFAGSVVGGIFVGCIADRFGRIPAVVASNLLGSIGGFASTFVTNFLQFSVCRFIMGMAFDTCMIIPYLIVLEFAAPKYRSLLANASFAVFFSAFATLYPFLALACGHWKILSLVSSLPAALAVLAPLFLPESPRWLLTKGRVEEVISKIQKIARNNRKHVPAEIITQFKETIEREQAKDQVSIYELFKNPLLRKNIILVCLVYITCQTILDCLFRSLGQLQFNLFISFAASSATELPSMLLCAFFLDVLGRRWLTVSMLTITSVACILIMLVQPGVQSVVCAIIARFVINTATGATIQWSAEMLPTTPVRGLGVAFVIISANLGMVSSPYISFLKIYSFWLPYMVMASLAGFGAVIAFMLPETANTKMPRTFEEAESLARNQKFWNIPYFGTDKKKNEGEVNQGFSL